MYVYALTLQNSHFYIGKTDHPELRLEEHFVGDSTPWVKLHGPVISVNMLVAAGDHTEDNTTLDYMQKYGIEKVRGGSFTQVQLSEGEISVLEKMIRSKTNACFECGQTGHYANACPQKAVQVIVPQIITCYP